MKLSLTASVDRIDEVTEFVNEQLEDMGCSRRAMLQIDVALDELFGNVCNYAYDGEAGPVALDVYKGVDGTTVCITIEDEGVPFNPLAAGEPDVTLGVEERKIGGLGIFMVRKTMDDVRYEYADGRNRLTIEKTL